MTSGYVLGRSREHSFIRKIRALGWFAMRSVGSKGGDPKMKVKPVDIVALRSGWEPRFVQISKRKRQITRAEIRELVRLAEQAGCTPVLIYKDGSRFASVDARDQKKRIDWK